MSKILIASLGTGTKEDGEYKLTKYKIAGKLYSEKIIAKALYRHIKFDKIFMIGTAKSMWDAVYEAFGGKDENIQFNLYGATQEGSSVKSDDLKVIDELWENNCDMSGSKTFIVDYGLDDKQLWDNFSIYLQITEYIKDGDEIYLDITHSFRSLALMSYIMLDFIKSMQQKDFSVKAIYYGMFEYTHEPSNMKKITPVINLKILFEINEWIKAISAFKNYGRAELVAENFNKQFGESDERTKYFARFSENISIANLAAIKSYVNRMREKISVLSQSTSTLIRLVSKYLIGFVKRMDKKRMSDFQLEMAKWFYENKNYAMSYIALAKSVVSMVCEREGIGLESEKDRDKAKQCLRDGKEYESLLSKYRTPNKVRNNIAHQLSERKGNAISDIENLEKRIKAIETEFKILDRTDSYA